jgi:hypothetical protein
MIKAGQFSKASAVEVFCKTECLPVRVKMMDGRKEGHNEVLSHSWV